MPKYRTPFFPFNHRAMYRAGIHNTVDAILGSAFLINSRCWKTFEAALFHLPHAEPDFRWPHEKNGPNQKFEPILASIINAL